MPIKTRYELRCNKKDAVLLSSYDRFYVETERELAQKAAPKGDILFMLPCVETEQPLTKAEEYLLLVYDVRCLQRVYFSQGRKHDDLVASLAKEKLLDQWNERTRQYIDAHAGFEEALTHLPADGERARHFAFFILVERWRKCWNEYFAYKKRQDKNPDVETQMKKKCFDLENTIDQTIKKELNL